MDQNQINWIKFPNIKNIATGVLKNMRLGTLEDIFKTFKRHFWNF